MQWEYKTVFGRCDLRELGAAGWELAAVDRAGDVLQHVFKRPAAVDPTGRFTLEQREAFFARQKAGAADGGTGIPACHPSHTSTDKNVCPTASRLLNADLAALVRRVGHTQMLLIADMGFPMPRGPETIDLSLSAGVPTIPQVLAAIGSDFVFDRIIAAEEMVQASPARDAELRTLHPKVLHERPAHVEFKHLAGECRAAIRTGDAVPYANVIVVGG